MKRTRLARRTELPRTAGPKRGKPIPKVGVRGKRLARLQFAEQAERCRNLPCCVCGAPPPSDPHHTVPRSRGGLDDSTVPLCRECHSRGHAIGWKSFEAEHGVSLESIAKEMG